MSRALWFLILLAAAGTAQASELRTWTTPSRFVAPDEIRVNEITAWDPARDPIPPPTVQPDKLRARVLLPDGYDGRRAVPILYLLHGVFENYASWSHPDVGDIRALAEGFPGVIVMPEGGRLAYMNWWNGGARGHPAYERFFFEELIPLVERRLRIRAGRRWHAIAGFSMGGLGATLLASQRPGYFGSVATLSGLLSMQRPEVFSLASIFGTDMERYGGDPVAQRFYWTGHNPVKLVANLGATRVYATAGDAQPGLGEEPTAWDVAAERQNGSMTVEFVRAAARAGVSVTYVLDRGTHAFPYARRRLADAIRWGFFRPVPETPGKWTYRTVAQTGEVFGFEFRFDEPPGELITFRRERERLEARGSGRVMLRTPAGRTVRRTLPFRLRAER